MYRFIRFDRALPFPQAGPISSHPITSHYIPSHPATECKTTNCEDLRGGTSKERLEGGREAGKEAPNGSLYWEEAWDSNSQRYKLQVSSLTRKDQTQTPWTFRDGGGINPGRYSWLHITHGRKTICGDLRGEQLKGSPSPGDPRKLSFALRGVRGGRSTEWNENGGRNPWNFRFTCVGIYIGTPSFPPGQRKDRQTQTRTP